LEDEQTRVPVVEALKTLTLPTVPQAEFSVMRDGQRKINLIWERTQAAIALIIVLANVSAWIAATVRGHDAASVPAGLTDALFVVVGFYYGRTNHQATGGVGPRPDNEAR
jgi:hypothetical protein